MKNSIKNLSIRTKALSLFAFAIVLPALFFGIVITVINRHALKDSIFYRQEEIVSRLTDRINSQLEQHQRLLSFRNDINALPEKQKIKYVKNMFKEGSAFAQIDILDAKNKTVFQYSIDKMDKKYALGTLKFRKNISGVIFSDDESPYMYIKAPLANKYNIVARLDFKQLWKWTREVKIGESGQAFIVDKKGNLIAHKEPERVLARSNFANLPVVKDFIEGRESSPKRWREYYDERGQKVVAMYKEIPKLNWAVVTQVPSSEVYKPVSDMYKSIVIWTAFWITIFLIIGLGFVHKIVDPLSKLRLGAEKISKGNLDIKLDIKTGDELEALAYNFETMAQALKKLETMKNDLTRMIIHDLKSPLAGITGSLDYLYLGYAGELSDEQKSMVELAKKSSANMGALVQNLLDIAKMEEGKLELKKEQFDIKELVNSKYQEFLIQAANEQKELTVELEDNIPVVMAEKNLIERVLNNLLNNAIKHTLSGGRIRLIVKRENNSLVISVSDDGQGIPDEFKEIIFEKFVQIERKKSHLRTGAGLGLTFCKMVVEAHGGNIWVESEVDKGSSFIFTLPLS